MKLERFEENLPPAIRPLYAAFEAELHYPLGPGRSFQIVHECGAHGFFGAMGPAMSVLAFDDVGICGSGAVAIRGILLPDGSRRSTAYFGDLRVAARARGSLCLFRVVRELETWARRSCDSGIAIVMDGTAHTPLDYTGRAGIPGFCVLGHTTIWLLTATHGEANQAGVRSVSRQTAEEAFEMLRAGRPALLCGEPTLRSAMTPEWILSADETACGCLEDTRLAKRLVLDDGSEIRSVHLSSFVFANPASGSQLLRYALSRAASLGFEHLFTAVAPDDAERLLPEISAIERMDAPATLFGAGISPCPQWILNTSEI